jgi:hypothetical protein
VNAPHGSWGIVSLAPKILLERMVRDAFLAQIDKPFLFLHSLDPKRPVDEFLLMFAMQIKADIRLVDPNAWYWPAAAIPHSSFQPKTG